MNDDIWGISKAKIESPNCQIVMATIICCNILTLCLQNYRKIAWMMSDKKRSCLLTSATIIVPNFCISAFLRAMRISHNQAGPPWSAANYWWWFCQANATNAEDCLFFVVIIISGYWICHRIDFSSGDSERCFSAINDIESRSKLGLENTSFGTIKASRKHIEIHRITSPKYQQKRGKTFISNGNEKQNYHRKWLFSI